jgi:hypothetical protein
LNDEIFIIEGEMEVTKSESALRKLDIKAEQLYLKRSMLEIENAGVVADMTHEEYNNELSKSNELIGMNQAQLNERVQVRDEVAKLKRESELNMQAAEKLREQARPIYDDIERADYYRQAYALEALAIDQQRQIQSICSNLEMLTQYTEPQLAMLKTGTVPAELRDEKSASAVASASNAEANNTALEQAMAENAAVAQQANPQEATKETTAAVTSSSAQTATNNQAAQPVQTVAVETPNTQSNAQMNEPAVVTSDSVEPSRTETAIAADNTATYTTRAETADPSKSTVVEVKEEPVAIAEPSAAAAASEVKPEQPKAPALPAAAEGKAKASANAADYYYSMPSEVIADLFTTTSRGVYSDSRPIPIDMEMPKGVYYKVQIGAFRNDIPQNLYDQFAPISGERLNTGITRYTAGFFVQFENAKDVKQQIRAMGYNDAFIVAYRDGKRIPLYEAAAITDGPELAASIKEAFDKAAVGSLAQNTNAVSNATTKTSAAPTQASQQVLDSSTAVASPNKTQTETMQAQPTAPSTEKNTINVDAEVAAELARKPATRSVAEIEAAAAQPKNTEYYTADKAQVAEADQVEKIQGLFYTVQVGVYSKPVAAALLQNVNPLNSELTETNKIRYTSGQFNNMTDAVNKRDEIRTQGIADAFVTAYYNGKRITLSEADLLLKEKGAGILAK